MTHFRIIGKGGNQTIASNNRMCLIRIDRIQIRYLDMRAKSNDLISHFTFKPDHYRYRYNHYSQSDSNTRHSNEDRRT